jgi:hypothetical protein
VLGRGGGAANGPHTYCVASPPTSLNATLRLQFSDLPTCGGGGCGSRGGAAFGNAQFDTFVLGGGDGIPSTFCKLGFDSWGSVNFLAAAITLL